MEERREEEALEEAMREQEKEAEEKEDEAEEKKGEIEEEKTEGYKNRVASVTAFPFVGQTNS